MNIETEDQIVSLYESGKCPAFISSIVGFSKTHIYRILTKRRVKMRTISEAKRKLEMDLDFFTKIDTHNKAQILGFIYADGCIPKRLSHIQIGIAREDHSYLEWIKGVVKYTGEVRIYKSRRPNEQDTSMLNLCSGKMVRDVIKLGCSPQKSQILAFPTEEQVPYIYINSFIRGYFEGDGSLSPSVDKKTGHPSYIFTMCGTRSFLEKCSEIFSKELKVHSLIREQVGIWILRISGNQQVLAVMEWLFKDSEYIMERKDRAYKSLVKANKKKRQQQEQQFKNRPTTVVPIKCI